MSYYLQPMNCSTPGFPVLHCLPEFAQTHVHRVSESEREVAQSCPTLCDPMDCSLPSSSVHVTWKWIRSVVSDSVTPWTVAYHAPPSMGFSRQEYWSGLPFTSPRSKQGRDKSEDWDWHIHRIMLSLSHVRLFVTPWTAAYQAPPSMRFSRQEYWSGLPLPSPIHTLQHVK